MSSRSAGSDLPQRPGTVAEDVVFSGSTRRSIRRSVPEWRTRLGQWSEPATPTAGTPADVGVTFEVNGPLEVTAT
ncbi:MAG: hypothetical protein R2855_03105 [Thermomicrobiales bacterium]